MAAPKLLDAIKKNKVVSVLVFLVVCWYLFLCAHHYWNQRPLWNDEECVFRSLKDYTPQQMFGKPLRALQVFPRCYLFLIQKFSKPFHFHLLSLRFPSFVCMILAFFLWLKLVKYELKNGMDYLIFVLSWAGSLLMIYYSAELKQYSMDVLISVLFLLFLYNQNRLACSQKKWLYPLILFLLPLSLFLSYTAFFFFLFPFWNILRSLKRGKKEISHLMIYMGTCLLVCLLSYFFDMRLRPENVLTEEWSSYFISFESGGEFFKTLGEGVNNLFSRFFADNPKMIKKISRFFVIFGLIEMFRSFFANIKKENYSLCSLKTIPFILFLELLIFGALKKYPFTVPRTSLFFCPIMFYMTIEGFKMLININKYLYYLWRNAYIVFLLVLTFAISQLIFGGDLGAMSNLFP